MISLYNLVGLSMLAGVGAMILMIPINGLIARLMKKLQKEQMKNKVYNFLTFLSIVMNASQKLLLDLNLIYRDTVRQ